MAERSLRRAALVVEDDGGIRELLRLHLDLAGFTIDEASEGRTALDRARSSPFDLILLDVMLPGLDGVSVCRAIRSGGPNIDTPILMLTARDGESDKVLGLESGADAYLTKPFGVRELMARIGAVLRRHQRHTSEDAPTTVVNAGDLSLDRDRRQATVRGEPVELTKQEFDLLSMLASRPGTVFTRAALLESVWSDDTYVTDRTVDSPTACTRPSRTPRTRASGCSTRATWSSARAPRSWCCRSSRRKRAMRQRIGSRCVQACREPCRSAARRSG